MLLGSCFFTLILGLAMRFALANGILPNKRKADVLKCTYILGFVLLLLLGTLWIGPVYPAEEETCTSNPVSSGDIEIIARHVNKVLNYTVQPQPVQKNQPDDHSMVVVICIFCFKPLCSFNGFTHSIWKFLCQGLNLSCSHSCSNARSLHLAGDWTYTSTVSWAAAVRFFFFFFFFCLFCLSRATPRGIWRFPG